MSTENKEYNGYTNYETWLCALWLDNDQGTNEAIREQAESLAGGMAGINDVDEETSVTGKLADFIKDMVDEMTPNAERAPSMFTDLLNAALSEIDYYDIAESRIADDLRAARKGRAA
jgi:hypothetical protein